MKFLQKLASSLALCLALSAVAVAKPAEIIDYSSNGLKTVETKLYSNLAARQLVLNDNLLTSLPPQLSQLSRLQVLWVSKNQLSSLPETFAALGQLEDLDLAENHFEIAPAVVGKLPKLQHLSLRRNRLSNFPVELATLESLVVLDLSENQIKSVPEIRGFSKLRTLNLMGNPLKAEEIQRLKKAFPQLDIIH